MTFGTLIAAAVAVWLLSCGASVLALYWSRGARARRYRAALVSSGVAILTAYLGLSRVHLSATRTVDGHVQWSLNSRWFFIAALMLGAAALGLAIWSWRQAPSRVADGAVDGSLVARTSEPPGA